MDITVIKTVFIKYLLMPLVVAVLVVVMGYIRKKVSPTIKNKTLILYVLICSLCLAIPGFLGFTGNTFNPYWYLFAMFIYLLLGILNNNLLHSYFIYEKKSLAFSILLKSLITITSMLLGGYLFFHIFNWISPFTGYGFMAATSITIFIVPLAFYYCYIRFMDIPFDIYKTWQYRPDQKAVDFDKINEGKIIVLNIELTKNIDEGKRFSINVKAIDQIVSFGDWFFSMVDAYNHKHPEAIIYLNSSENEPYSWIFYTKKSIFHFRKFIDFDNSIAGNGITENSTIYCKRVIRHEQVDELKK
ncbi:MAG: TssN family type VI secretion system protein [Chitinophagaceae bacterium]|jgi:hypothetical protein|nr:TssN family type VI secretion system protein [Chitinophagaceae bacterium]